MTAVDPRLYILGGLLLLAVVVFLYLVGALVRYRKAVRRTFRATGPAEIESCVDTPGAAVGVQAEDIFAPSVTTVQDPLGGPLRTGSWRPDAQSPAPAAPVADIPPLELTVAEAGFDVTQVESDLDEPATTVTLSEHVPVPSPAYVSLSELESEVAPDPLLEPAVEPDLAARLEPAIEPGPAPGSVPNVDGWLPPGRSAVPGPTVVHAPLDVASIIIETPPHERISGHGETGALVHSESAAPQVVLPADNPVPLSTGSVLSAASAMASTAGAIPAGTVDESATVDGPAGPLLAIPEKPLVENPAAADAREYVLVAPVELHFTLGEGRVGVKHGSRTYAEFRRLADVLMDDYRSSGGCRPS